MTKIIIATDEAWALLEETLQMDAKSNAFDRTLRDDIQAALDSLDVQTSETNPGEEG